MSSQRIADAALVSPYPLDIQQGRSAGGPPDSFEQEQSSKSKKGFKSRARVDRNPRPEEERFNVGPRNTRNTSAARNGNRRQARTGRADRPYLNDLNDGVPNYPPPSFQEAISSPPICPSMVTLGVPPAGPLLPPLSIPSFVAGTPPRPVQPPQPTLTKGVGTESDLNSDSDDSLQIIGEDDTLPPDGLPSGPEFLAKVKQDWFHRRGVEFPSPSSPTFEQGSNKNLNSETRGRAPHPKPPPLVIDGPDQERRSPTIASPKRRFLSLSPLRIFPSRNPPDHPQSAHPSPGMSPYSQSARSATFFRSTTSLANASFLRLPLTSVSHNGRTDSFISRKFFSHKGKERAKTPEPPEALDSWEELTAEDAQGPASLMSVMERVTNQQPSSPTVGVSPTRSLSFTYGTPTAETFRPLHASLASLPAETTRQENIQPSVHPLSLRDRKTPFIQRPVRQKAVPPPIKVNPNPLPVPQGPILTTVRTRMPQIPPQSAPSNPRPTAQVGRPSPLSMDASSSPSPFEAQQNAAACFQKALETPLPDTPVNQAHPDESPSTPAKDMPVDTIQSPLSARPGKAVDSGLSNVATPVIEQGQVFSQAPTPLLDEPITPTRHHYPGRPLPRTPQLRPHIDSTFAPNDEFEESPVSANLSACPEGLLIDLNDTPPTPAEIIDNLESASNPLPPPLLPLVDDPPLNPLSTPPAIVVSIPALPSCAPASPKMQSTPRYSEVTDLDLLVSTLTDEGQSSGSNYDAFLMVAEFLGPATSPRRTPGDPSLTNSSACQPTTPDNGNITLIGRVELVRRRTTKDGRVKLKFALCGVAVDRCGVCLSQFKSEQTAGLTSVCHHAFHDCCLERWLARNKSCPLCRVPLDADK